MRNTVAYSQQHDENGTSYTCGRGIWLTRFVLSFIAYKSWCQRLPSQTSHSPTPTTHLLHSQFYWSERVAWPQMSKWANSKQWRWCVSPPGCVCFLCSIFIFSSKLRTICWKWLHGKIEGAGIPQSILRGELLSQEGMSILTVVWERTEFCYNITFWESLLKQFIFPDQMADTKQINVHFRGSKIIWENRREAQGRTEAQQQEGKKWVHFLGQSLGNICS